jgi:Transmembrane family 220, helix
MKIFNFFFVFVFIVFAALQYNDPDPYIWMPLYLYAALLCWFAVKKKFYPKAYWLGFAVYGAYAVYKIFDQNGLEDWITKHHAQNLAATMKAETPWVEESREFFGLVIMIAVLAINYIYLTKYQRGIRKAGVNRLKRS